jgi:isocitrate/isopropylmalate dehydrogenase
VYRAKQHLTRDMGGQATTGEFADAVIEALQSGSPAHRPEAIPV